MNTAVRAGSVVAGIDGSEHDARTVAWAGRQAGLEHRPLDIVHCQDLTALTSLAMVGGSDELANALRLDAQAVLVEASRLAASQAPDLDIRTHLLTVDPRNALVGASKRAHLLVVGSRGRGPVRSMLLGSVSSRVARHAECPVVVCRPTTVGIDGARVLVGADGTAASVPVIEFAFQQASRTGAPLTVMHCFFDATGAVAPSRLVPASDSEGLVDQRLLLSESVAGLREKFPDVEVTLQLARGLVDLCLLDQAPAVALVVVGRTPVEGVDRFLDTSCAIAVLERATTTVAVVPEASPEQSN